jgi:hypothetical protein
LAASRARSKSRTTTALSYWSNPARQATFVSGRDQRQFGNDDSQRGHYVIKF